MVNGPPTPPPTTETEIQDEARNSAENIQSVASDSISSTTTPQDAFQAVFPTIIDLASQSNFHGLIRAAESACIQSDLDSSRRLTRLLVLGPLVLAYLIVDDLPPARFALTQLPTVLAATPLSNTLFDLLVSTWDRKHANVYARAQKLTDVVQHPNFFDKQLAIVLSESFRRRTVILLSNAYASLPLPLAQMYLGMGRDELLAGMYGQLYFHDRFESM
ncbi:hypothetical protein H0H93_011725 [Arthromyces matolae]|nr:hypothetical protein H0H93_011725 [Arthromyces matolae]